LLLRSIIKTIYRQLILPTQDAGRTSGLRRAVRGANQAKDHSHRVGRDLDRINHTDRLGERTSPRPQGDPLTGGRAIPQRQ
jgi:hypothetical protein